MRIGILAAPDSWHFRDLCRAARARGHDARPVDFGSLVGTVGSGGIGVTALSVEWIADDFDDREAARARSQADKRAGQWLPAEADTDLCRAARSREKEPFSFDACIVRIMPPASLEQVVFRMDALATLEQCGIVVLNPAKSIEAAVDKFLTTVRLCQAGLPVPRTIACETEDAAWEAFATLGRRVVVKPLFGSEGRGIVQVADEEMAYRVFRTLDRMRAVLYLQELIDHPGFDIRVLVLDGRVLGAITRHSTGDFRTNIARRAIARPHDCSDEQAELARLAADAVGARVAGVDLLQSRDGRTFVIEVNAVPGWKALSHVLRRDVAGAIIAALERSTDHGGEQFV